MRWVYLFIMVAGLASCAWAQYPVDSTNTQAAAFAYDVVPFRLNDTTGRVDVYIQIPYASLVFIHEFDKYSAKYAVIVQFRSRTDSIVTEKSYPEVLTEKTFENASGRSKKVVFLQKVFALPVGDYTVEMTLSDENAHTMKPYLQKVHIPDYAHLPVGMSGILLASRIQDANGKKSITPYVLRNASALRGGASMFFEIYDKKPGDTVDAAYRIVKPNGDTALASKRIPLALTALTMQQYLTLPIDTLSQMRYTLTLGLFPHSADANAPVDFGDALTTASHVLAIDWGVGLPRMLEDVDKAIEELRWAATSAELDSLVSAPTAEDKRARFLRFWERRNPFPGAARNEAMETYYSRVQYANDHYKSLSEGWQSDQGMISIIFGQPTTVEPHPFDYKTYGAYSGPYVIWYYDRYGKQFIFIDQDGFGDFRLAGPPPFERYVYGQ